MLQRNDVPIAVYATFSPYFTGFVMLLNMLLLGKVGRQSFSPLFYGIRDVTEEGSYTVTVEFTFQSPILRDS